MLTHVKHCMWILPEVDGVDAVSSVCWTFLYGVWASRAYIGYNLVELLLCLRFFGRLVCSIILTS